MSRHFEPSAGPSAGVPVPPSLLHRFLGEDSNDEFHRTASRVLTNLSARLSKDVKRQNVTESPTRLGAYRIEAPLGHGGMGTVYRGVHETTGKAVAIKTAPAGSELAAILREEASALGGIDHRGVVQVFDHGVDGDIAWMAMQLVRGQTLRTLFEERWSKTNAPLSQLEVARFLGWMCELASALHAMHQKGIVHRDVKPSNLMIADDGAAYVIDFGLSLDVSADPIVDALAGTVPYMSPEQVLAMTQLDGRSDVYSLAACFYELFSGRKLVVADERRVGVFREIAFGIAKPLSSVAAGVPKVYDGVFAKALAKDPAMRYATALDFATDVQRVQKGKAPLFAREPIALALSRRWRSIVASLVVLSALFVLGDAWWQRRAVLADFRARCATARDGDANAAIDALSTALRIRDDFAGDREFEDVYTGALASLTPRLTTVVFQRAALVPTNMAHATVTGRIGHMAGLHLASGLDLTPETQVELAVQNALYLLRSDAEDEALKPLRALPDPVRSDERVRLLEALVQLIACREQSKGDATAVRAFALSVSTDFANLTVDRLCCRAMLLIEVSTGDRVGEILTDTDFAPSAPLVHAGIARATSLDAALLRQEEMRGALVRLDVALANALRETAADRVAGNMLATLLALVRLHVGNPASALSLIEDRLSSDRESPEPAERSALVLISAAAGFRMQVSAQTTDAEEMQRVVVRFREAAEAEPQLAARFVREIGRGDSQEESPLRKRFDVVCAEFLDELLRVRAEPKVYTAPILLLTQFGGYAWDARGWLDGYAHVAMVASQNDQVLEAEGNEDNSASRVFWYCAINVASKMTSWTVEERLARCEQFAEFAKKMTPPDCIEAEVALLRARRELMPSDAATAALAEAVERWKSYREGLGNSLADGYLRMVCDDFLSEYK